MEEIEYLEEYEDLILPAISDNASTANTSQNSKSGNSSTLNVNARRVEDEDSSSIDQDIFESLFDDNSDDDAVLSKKVDSKIGQRREDRVSMDSLDMLVKDLGEQLSSNVVSTTNSITESSTTKSNANHNKTISKGVSSSSMSKSYSKLTYSMKSKQTIEKTKSELGNSNKPKSVATVRPTIQNQQQKRLLLTKTGNVSSLSSSTTTTTTSAASSSSGRLGPANRPKASTAGSMPGASTSSIVSKSIKLSNVDQTKGAIAQKKSISRPQPTIIKPEKPSTNKDPAEDPLSLEDIGGGLTSDSDSSFVYSDISDDSFASLSDLNDTDEYMDGDNSKGSSVAAKSNLVSSSVERVNKNQDLVTTTQNDKNSLISETKQSENVCSSSAVSSIAASTPTATKMSDGTKNKNESKGKGKESNAQSTSVSNEKSNVASSVLELTKNLPEKVTIISDTILNRIDSEFIRTITATDDKKDQVKALSTTEKETRAVDTKETSENMDSSADMTVSVSLSNSNEKEEIMRMSPDLENVANTEEVLMNRVSSSEQWDETNNDLESHTKNSQQNNDLQKELCVNDKTETEQKNKDNESDDIVKTHNKDASVDENNKNTQEIQAELNSENKSTIIKEKSDNKENEKGLEEKSNEAISDHEKTIEKEEGADNVQSVSDEIKSTERNTKENNAEENSQIDGEEMKKKNNIEDTKETDDDVIQKVRNRSGKKNMENPSETKTLNESDGFPLNTDKTEQEKKEEALQKVSESISEASEEATIGAPVSSQETEKNVCIESTKNEEDVAMNEEKTENTQSSQVCQEPDKDNEAEQKVIEKKETSKKPNKRETKNLEEKLKNGKEKIKMKGGKSKKYVEKTKLVKEKKGDDKTEYNEKCTPQSAIEEQVEEANHKTVFTEKTNNENENSTSKSEKKEREIIQGNVEDPSELVTSTQQASEVTEEVVENEQKEDVGNGSDDHAHEKIDGSKQREGTEEASGIEEDYSVEKLKPRFIMRRRNQIIDNDVSEKTADRKTPLQSVVDEPKIKKSTADTSKNSVGDTTIKEVIEDIKITIKDNDNLSINKSSEKKTIDFLHNKASDDNISPRDKKNKDTTELSTNDLASDIVVEKMNTALVKYTIESIDKHEKETHEKAHGDVEAITRRSLRKRNADSPLLSNDNIKTANRTSTASTNASQNVKHATQTSAKTNTQVSDEEVLKKYPNLSIELKRKSGRVRKSEDTTESETDETKKLKLDTSVSLDKSKDGDKMHEPLDKGKGSVPGHTAKARILNTTDKGKVEGEPPYKIPRLSSSVKEASATDNISITDTKKPVAKDSAEISNSTLNNSRDECKKDERNYIRKTTQKLTSLKYGKTVKGAEENKSVFESKSPNKSHISTRASPNKPASSVMTFNEWLQRQNVKPESDIVSPNNETDEVNDTKNMSESDIVEHDKSNETDKSTAVNESQSTRPKSTRRILLLPKSDRAKEIPHKNEPIKINVQVSKNTEAQSKIDNRNAETISQAGIAIKAKIQKDEKISEQGYEKNKKKKAKAVTKTAELTTPIKSPFKMPQEPATNRRAFTPKKSNNDEHHQPKNMNSIKIKKCRKLRVRINRAVVAAYFRNLEQSSKSKINTDSLNQKPNAKAPITPVTPIHLTRASSKTPVALHHPESKASEANQVKDTPPSTDSQSRPTLNTAQPEHIVPSLDHLTDDNASSSVNENVPAVLHTSSSSNTSISNTRSKSAKSEIRLRVPIAGRANVLTIPPQNRRPTPMSTRQTQQTQQTSNASKPDRDQQAKDVETGLLRNNFGSQPYLTRSHRKPVPMQLNASVHSERSMPNKSTVHPFDVKKMSPNVMAMESPVVSQNAVEANEQTTSALPAELNATTENAIVPEVKEEIDELRNISLPTESANVPANIFGGSAFSSHISNGTMFGVTPTALDANGTRLYSFLHPAKYSRSHGMVVLDYCCPNLDGPMSAIDPTRIHAQIQAPVRELPAYIVMTTKLITRADLEANNTGIPALIRQKVEKITATNSKTQTVTKASVTTAPTNAAKQKTQTPLPQTVSVLQKHLTSTTTNAAKSLTPALRTFNTASGGAINPINAGLPTLTPFSAFSQTQAANMTNSTLTEGQRNLLRTNLRRFDSLLKKSYHRIALLSLPNRQLIIESIIRDNMNNGGNESLQPKDVEHAMRVLEAYVKHMDSITSTPEIVVTSASDMPPSELINTGSCNVANRKKTMSNPNTSSASTPNSKMHAPIFDSERNIIGWQLKVATTSTATATTSTSGNILTRSVMSTRSESLFSTSASGTGTPGLMAAKRIAPTQQLSRLSAGQQDTSRLFYSKTSMQTSTPIAGNPTVNTTNSPATPINSIRGGRGITLKQVQKHANTPVSGSMHTASSPASSTTSTAITPTYATAQSASQAARASKSSSIRVTRQRAAAVDMSAVKTAGTKTNNANVSTVAQNEGHPPKILVINKDNSGNNLPTPDECILPDNTDSRDGQNVANAIIKHEQMDDDFIGGH